MNFSAPAKLYLAAAVLFVGVVGIGVYESGLEPKAAIGLIMAGALVRLGLRARTTK